MNKTTDANEVTSVGEDFPKEQTRCRELLIQYLKIGPSGILGATMIENVLRQADQAMSGGDIVEIVKAYQAMKELQ